MFRIGFKLLISANDPRSGGGIPEKKSGGMKYFAAIPLYIFQAAGNVYA